MQFLKKLLRQLLNEFFEKFLQESILIRKSWRFSEGNPRGILGVFCKRTPEKVSTLTTTFSSEGNSEVIVERICGVRNRRKDKKYNENFDKFLEKIILIIENI